MTRQHFQLIAEALAEARQKVELSETKSQKRQAIEKQVVDQVEQSLIKRLKRTNGMFDRARFEEASTDY